CSSSSRFSITFPSACTPWATSCSNPPWPPCCSSGPYTVLDCPGMSRPSWRDGSKKRPRSGRTDYGAKTTNQPKNYLQLPLELLEEEVRALPLLFTVFPLLCFT